MRHRLLLLVLTALLLLPAAAQAADSHAPHGARLDWLPSDEWVMSGWLPYDEARLYDLVHTDRAEVDAWLDDHRTLGQLARTRGWTSQRKLAHALVAPRLKGVRPATFRHLRGSALSPTAIAQRGGRTRAGAQARVAALLKARGARAVKLGATSRAQAKALYAEQMAALPAFMRHTYRTPSQQVSFLCRPH